MHIEILMDNLSLGVLQDMIEVISMIVSATGREETIAERIDIEYAHGGGYQPMKGWSFEPVKKTIKFAGEEKLFPVIEISIKDEKVYIYAHALVAIIQSDGSFAVLRMY